MEFLVILVLIALNGIFALSEMAFVSASRDELEELRDKGNRNAAAILRLMDQPERFLSAIQVGITLIGVVSGAFSGIALAGQAATLLAPVPLIGAYAFEISLVFIVGVVTYLSIVAGELVPKTIALKNPEKSLLLFFPLLRVLSTVLHPLVNFLSWSTRAILKLLRMKPAGIDDEEEDPVAELLGHARDATLRNMLDKEQETILVNTVNVRKKRVRDVMVARDDMIVLRTDMTLAQAMVEAHLHHHTRYPLVDQETGKVLGYINFKDIVNVLRINPRNPSLHGICRPLLALRETEKVTEALRKLIKASQHIAVVRDAQAQLLGLVSMENLIETIVGDIKDEYDVLPEFLYEIDDLRYLAGGGVSLRRLHDEVSPLIPAEDRALGLWLLDVAKAPLKVESKVVWQGLTCTVRKVSRKRINEVIIEAPAAAPPAPNGPAA